MIDIQLIIISTQYNKDHRSTVSFEIMDSLRIYLERSLGRKCGWGDGEVHIEFKAIRVTESKKTVDDHKVMYYVDYDECHSDESKLDEELFCHGLIVIDYDTGEIVGELEHKDRRNEDKIDIMRCLEKAFLDITILGG